MLATGILTIDLSKDEHQALMRFQRGDGKSKDLFVPHTFPNRFARTPTVLLALSGMFSSRYADTQPNIAVEPVDVTPAGFQIRILHTEKNTIDRIVLTWLATDDGMGV